MSPSPATRIRSRISRSRTRVRKAAAAESARPTSGTNSHVGLTAFRNTRDGDCPQRDPLARKAGLAQRAAGPCEVVAVPAGQLRERHAVLGRVDEPPVADVDAGV